VIKRCAGYAFVLNRHGKAPQNPCWGFAVSRAIPLVVMDKAFRLPLPAGRQADVPSGSTSALTGQRKKKCPTT
jgi:hypothetical protein